MIDQMITLFNTEIEYIMQHTLLLSITMFVVFFLLSKISIIITEKIILQITKRTETDLDDLIVEMTRKPISILLLLIGIRLSLIPWDIHSKYMTYVNIILISCIIIVIGSTLINIGDLLIKRLGFKIAKKSNSEIDDQLLSLIHRFMMIIGWVIMGLIILKQWGVEIGPFLASLGIAGIAVAFALQSTLSNIFGGISLIVDKTFKIGDVVKLDDGTVGKIYAVSLRSTKINTVDNEIVTIPNGVLANGKIQNLSQPDIRLRDKITVGVSYKSDPEKVSKLLIESLKNVEHVAKDPVPQAIFNDFGASTLNFILFYHVDDLQFKMQTHQAVMVNIVKLFKKEKIEIPFSQMEVKIKK